MQKSNNWVPIAKELIQVLPTSRPYSIVEAVFSFQVDLDNGISKSEREYSRIWKWSRSRVHNLLTATVVPDESQPRAKQKPIKVRIIREFSNRKGQDRTTQEPNKSHPEATTINTKTKNIKYFLDLIPEELKQDEFVGKWKEWIDFRIEIKKKVTESTAKRQFTFLKKQTDPITCIEKSIFNGWQGLFEIKNNKSTNHQAYPGLDGTVL